MSNLAPAVGFCLKVIELLSEQTAPIGISEISHKTDINKNMISRILKTLEEGNWVQCDDKSRYSLTLLPFCLTSRVVNQFSLVNVSIPHLQKLWKEFGESTYLGILKNDEVLYLSHFDSVQPVRVAGVVGGSYPLYCTAPGKVLLAYSSEDYIESYLKRELRAYTQNTLTDRNKLHEELARIRSQGYALDNEEFGRGIVCMAAPVLDYQNEAVGVIGCSFSTVNCKVEEIYDRCGEFLLNTAQQISKCMGCILP